MAGMRLIGREIATSLRLNELSERAELAYLKAMPFTCRDGRLPGEARKLRGLCYPMRDWTVADVEGLIRELTEAGLWFPYEDSEGRNVIEVLRFHDHQPGVKPGTARYKGERASPFGPPVSTDTRPTRVRPGSQRGSDTGSTRNCDDSDTGSCPKVREGKRNEEKGPVGGEPVESVTDPP